MRACVGRLLLLLAGLVSFAAASPSFAGERAAPSFVLKDINGRKFDLKDHLSHDVVVVNFFATWCTPCMAELPTLEALHEKYASQGLRIVAVSVDDPKSASKVKPLVREHGWKFPVLLDTETKVVSLYNPRKAVPFTAVIDRSGNVVAERTGFKPEEESAFEEELKALLAPNASNAPNQTAAPAAP